MSLTKKPELKEDMYLNYAPSEYAKPYLNNTDVFGPSNNTLLDRYICLSNKNEYAGQK